jgi:hypothetical protein
VTYFNLLEIHTRMRLEPGAVAQACKPSYSGGKKQDPISKITEAQRAGSMVQMVECLPSKREALSSNQSTTKKKKKKIKKNEIGGEQCEEATAHRESSVVKRLLDFRGLAVAQVLAAGPKCARC